MERTVVKRMAWLGVFLAVLVGLGFGVFFVLSIGRGQITVANEAKTYAVRLNNARMLSQLVGNFGMGAIFGLAGFLGSLAILAPGFFLAYHLQSLALGFAAVALIVLWIVAIGLVNSTLHGIYSAAVYRYAVDGVTGGYLREDLVREAFRPG
jgi:hypothetical protein